MGTICSLCGEVIAPGFLFRASSGEPAHAACAWQEQQRQALLHAPAPALAVGDQVRWYEVGTGWQFGTVAGLYPPDLDEPWWRVAVGRRGQGEGTGPAEAVLLACYQVQRCSR